MNIKKQWLPITVSLLVALFLILSVWNLKYRTKDTIGHVIASEVVQLQKVFERIHQDCGILNFDYQKNPINFLNVKSFVGSEVGSMNLTYPDRWKGPYMPDNPVVEGKAYQIVHTKQGYFITPGEGVKLPNGKVIGKDIIFDENTDIRHMICAEGDLSFENMPLAVELKLEQQMVVSAIVSPEDTE